MLNYLLKDIIEVTNVSFWIFIFCPFFCMCVPFRFFLYCLSMSVCLCLSCLLSMSVCLYLSCLLSVCISLVFCLPVCLCISLLLSIFLSISLFLSLSVSYLSYFLSFCLLSIWFSLSLFIHITLSPGHFDFIYTCLFSHKSSITCTKILHFLTFQQQRYCNPSTLISKYRITDLHFSGINSNPPYTGAIFILKWNGGRIMLEIYINS